MLNEKKISSRSILGWQLPILTDSNHSKARILQIDTRSFKKYLEDYKVLVVAGFQGVSKQNRITTLGRGGSDTSAVAIACSMGLQL